MVHLTEQAGNSKKRKGQISASWLANRVQAAEQFPSGNIG